MSVPITPGVTLRLRTTIKPVGWTTSRRIHGRRAGTCRPPHRFGVVLGLETKPGDPATSDGLPVLPALPDSRPRRDLQYRVPTARQPHGQRRSRHRVPLAVTKPVRRAAGRNAEVTFAGL